MDSSSADSRFEFDTILGELDDLEKQFDAENNATNSPPQTEGTFKPSTDTNLPKACPPNMSQALEEFSLINSQLEDVLNDLAGFVTKPPEPIKSPPITRVKPPPPPVPSKSNVQALKTQQSFEGDAKIPQVMSPPVRPAPPNTGNGLMTERQSILPDHKPIEKKQEMRRSDSPPIIQVFPNEYWVFPECVDCDLMIIHSVMCNNYTYLFIHIYSCTKFVNCNLADILSAFCIQMGCEGTLIDLPFI